ncbi:Serine-protein kinase ATM [Dirofilaria immitis]
MVKNYYLPIAIFLFHSHFDRKLVSSRNTIMVDQDNRLWLWSDKKINTFALRVPNAYCFGRNGPKTLICKTQEPDTFKALFANRTTLLMKLMKTSLLVTHQSTLTNYCDYERKLRLLRK